MSKPDGLSDEFKWYITLNQELFRTGDLCESYINMR